MYVCMYAVCICMYVHAMRAYVCVYLYTCVCTYVCMVSIHTYVHMYVVKNYM